MRNVNFVLLLIILFLIYDFVNYDFVNLYPEIPSRQHVYTQLLVLPKLNFYDFVVMTAFSILIIQQLYISLLYYSRTIRYVRFSNNLSILGKKSVSQRPITTSSVTHLLYFIFSIDSFESLFISITIVCEIYIIHSNTRFFIFHMLNYIICRCKTIYSTYELTLKLSLKTIHYLSLLFKKSLYLSDIFSSG